MVYVNAHACARVAIGCVVMLSQYVFRTVFAVRMARTGLVRGLLTQAEVRDNLAIPVNIGALEVVE